MQFYQQDEEEETCFKITADDWAEVMELQCTQEEIRHQFVCARTGSKAVTTEETDVMLLWLAFQTDIRCPIN